MGTHYKVYIFDDHLGLLGGRTGEQEAEKLSADLKAKNAKLFLDPIYYKEMDCIFFELRKDHPKNYTYPYDNVYYSQDDSGSHLNLLKGVSL